jgi:uncharacterized protein (DUF1697 family)
MARYVALLRAVNVGGTGKLPMKELVAMCTKAGFTDARTYIASGNVVFDATPSEAKVKSILEAALYKYAGKPVGVFVRNHAELAAVLKANPFPDAAPNRTIVVFLDEAPPKDALKNATGVKDEVMKLGKREIYIHYGEGMGSSKLKIPAATHGTARNMNTVAKLAEMSKAP